MKHIISLGAGVQSSTMALMAAKGEITPMPDAAIFSDTQAEPESVYEWLNWLEKQLPFPVFRVTKGSLADVSLQIRNKRDGSGQWTKTLIPFYTMEPDGSRGKITRRPCTADYKIIPILKEQRRIAGIKRGQKTIGVVSWIGISLDEVMRMKPSRVDWCQHRWPLIEKSMTRHGCLHWMEKNGFPVPPRSACVFCPFHHDTEWKRLRDQEPGEFARAVQFEKDLQATKAQTNNMRGVPYLHSSMIPLGDVVFGDSGPDLFTNECEGMCGV